jgi:hypothetical protein
MRVQILPLLLLLLFAGSLAFGQDNYHRQQGYVRLPIDPNASMPTEPESPTDEIDRRVAERERVAEIDFQRKVAQVSKEWNRWLDMRNKQDAEEHTVDLNAICKERKQLEKIAKLVEALQKHPASPCIRCPDGAKK